MDSLKFSSWLDAYAEKAMERMDVPGAAIGVLKGDQLIYLKGLGSRDVEKKLPVNEDTIFPIASMTKSFTAALSCIAMEEKNVSWDSHVRTLLPEFHLYDKNADAMVSLKDLGSHRTGLLRHDLMGFNFTGSRREFVRRMQYLKPYGSFRGEAKYQNQIFACLGAIPESLWGITWEEALQEKLLKPLQMTRSMTSLEKMLKDENHMEPYGYREGKMTRLAFGPENHMASAPAGRLKCSLRDMMNYISLFLHDGKFEGKQIISENNIREMHTPHAVSHILDAYLNYPEFSTSHYGIGWFIDDFRGHRMAHHGGNGFGWTSHQTVVKDQDLAIVILTNQDHSVFTYAMTYSIIDKLLAVEDVDWVERYLTLKKKQDEQKAKQTVAHLSGKIDNTPCRELEEFVGRYVEPGYGEVEISLVEGALKFHYHPNTYTMTHYHYDVFSMFYEDAGVYFRVKFEYGLNGKINGFVWELPTSEGGLLSFKKQ